MENKKILMEFALNYKTLLEGLQTGYFSLLSAGRTPSRLALDFLIDEIKISQGLLSQHTEANKIFSKGYLLLDESVGTFRKVELSDLAEALESKGQVSPENTGNPVAEITEAINGISRTPFKHLVRDISGLLNFAVGLVGAKAHDFYKRTNLIPKNYLLPEIISVIASIQHYLPEAEIQGGTMPLFVEGSEKLVQMFKRENFPLYQV